MTGFPRGSSAEGVGEGLPGSPIDVAEWLYQDAGAGVVADVTIEPETGGRVVSVDFLPAPTGE